MKHADLPIAVIIPAYNEATTIRSVVLTALSHVHTVYVIDDCSIDATCQQLEDLPVTLIRNDQNQGKAYSLMRGFQAALDGGAEAVISLDADGQHDANDIPRLWRAAQKHPQQLVIAARLINCAAAPRSRYYANKIADFFISWACGRRIYDSQSGFRLYPAIFLKTLLSSVETRYAFAFESKLLLLAASQNISCRAVPIRSHYAEDARPSYFRPSRDILQITRVVAGDLIRRGFHLKGLWQSLKKSDQVIISD